MNYKLIEDKNGTIVSKGKRYKMNKLEYTKEEYKEYQARKMKDYDEFMKNYEPDYMWRN